MRPSSRISLLRVLRFLFFTAASIAMLGGAAFVADYLIMNPRKPEHAPPVVEIPSVEVAAVELSEAPTSVYAIGTVIPADEVTLQAQVSGQITGLHPDFLEGGLVSAGEILVEIDPRDYELTLEQARTNVVTAEANLKIELGQQDMAKHEWDMFEMKDKATALDEELALRKPYLSQTEAALEAARLQVRQAELNLERTKIKAPFNAIIQSADVRAGDLATTQTQLAQLASTDLYRVLVLVAVDDLKWLEFPRAAGDTGSVARITSEDGSKRTGHAVKILGSLEDGGLLAQVLVEVRDPLGRNAEGADAVPLLLGDRVQVKIEGKPLADVLVLPRTALRDGVHVWTVNEENRLVTVTPDIVWRGEDTVFCRGLDAGTDIIVSDLATPVEGMELQVIGAEEDSGAVVSAATGVESQS